MAAQQSSDVRALYLEKLKPALDHMFRQEGPDFAEIEKGPADQVSPRTMRISLRITPGGKYRAYNPDGGSLGLGSGQHFEEANLTPTDRLFAVQWTKQVEYATDTGNKAVKNAVKDSVEEVMNQFRQALDSDFQTAGDGIWGTIGGVAGTTITLTNNEGSNLFYEGQTIAVVNAAISTNRGTATITSIPTPTTIVVDAVPGGTIATDLIMIDGLTAVGAIATPPTGIYGLKYHISDATTGTWLNLNRATFAPKLSSPSVNGGGAALAVTQPRLLRDLIRRRLGRDAAKAKRRFLVNVEQLSAWENLAQTNIRINRTAAGGEQTPDLLFKEGSDDTTIAGYRCLVNIHHDPTVMWLVDFSQWGRAELYPLRFYTDKNGNKFFTIVSTVDGAPTAQEVFYLQYGGQFYTTNPGAQGYIKALAKPAGY